MAACGLVSHVCRHGRSVHALETAKLMNALARTSQA
jgi:hypothetical protein